MSVDAEIPTADAIAYAVVAAASVTGEDPLAIADGGGWLRLRAPTVRALRDFYPEVSWDRLGAMVGYPGATQPRVQSAQRAGWWEDVGQPAYEAAFAALEAL